MNPTFLDDMSWEMAEVYGAVSDQILINLAHYFPWYDESKLPRSTFAYQADMLAQMGKVSRDAVNIIHRNLDGADEALRGILEQAIIDSIRATNPPLLDAAKRGILQPAGVPIVAPNQMRAYSLYYKQAADKLNLVNTVMLESTQQAYAATVADVVARVQATQTALDIGAGEAITGVSSWNQATQHAIRRMADRGITGFIDHGGHRWSAEAYVAMDIRTTVANTARSAVWETNENFGNDLYSVSYHNGARPLCYPWQNKVISATDQARTVTDLDGNEITVYAQSDTTYGQAAGLFGINCKHYPTPFIPGVSLIRGEPQDKEANDLAYEQSQEQRRLERKLREDRRDLMMMKARGVPEEQIKAQQAKCERSSQEIQDFCDSTGRTRRRNREGVYTERTFPNPGTYDVAEFEHEQRDLINEWFKNGGNDNDPPPHPTNIHLDPNDIPPRGQMQIPIKTGRNETGQDYLPGQTPQQSNQTERNNSNGSGAEENKQSYYKSFKGFEDLSDEQAKILDARFKELDSKYHARVEHIGTTLSEEQKRYDEQLENRIQYEMEQNPRMRRSTAEKKAKELLGERPTLHGKGWLGRVTLGGEYWPNSPMYGNESLLTVNPDALIDAKDIFEDIAKRERRIARDAKRISEGRSAMGFANVSGSLEGTFIHEYGHAIDFTYGIAEDEKFIAFYRSLTDEEREISTYALTNEREFIAEAFAESFMGDTQGNVSKRFMKVLEAILSDNA